MACEMYCYMKQHVPEQWLDAVPVVYEKLVSTRKNRQRTAQDKFKRQLWSEDCCVEQLYEQSIEMGTIPFKNVCKKSCDSLNSLTETAGENNGPMLHPSRKNREFGGIQSIEYSPLQNMLHIRGYAPEAIKSCLFRLPVIEPRRQYKDYAPLTHNIGVEDEYFLPFLPHLGNDDSKTDTEFCSELLKVYGGRLHGQTTGDMALCIDDELLVAMVKTLYISYRLATLLPGEKIDEDALKYNIHVDLIPEIVFAAISAYWPWLGSSKILAVKYEELTDSSKLLELVPSIDDKKFVACSPEKVSNSYEQLFCPRCVMYDCLLHKKIPPPPARKVESDQKTIDREPCSNKCFMLLACEKSLTRKIQSYKGKKADLQKLAKKKITRKAQNKAKRISKKRQPKNTRQSSRSSAIAAKESIKHSWCALNGRKPGSTGPEHDRKNNISSRESSSRCSSESLDTRAEATTNESETSEGEYGVYDSLARDMELAAQWSSVDRPDISRATAKWTDQEIVVARMAGRVHRGNYCAMVRWLGGSKTCAQIYRFCRGDQCEPDHHNRSITPRKGVIKRGSSRRRAYGTFVTERKHRAAYVPCDHPGEECAPENNCECRKNNMPCEKFCGCQRACANRFRGCNCTSVCTTKACPCFVAERECDPDLCRSCCADEKSTLVRRKMAKGLRCKNMAIQFTNVKTLFVGNSRVAGYGCFAGEDIAANELVCEYCGEVISQFEADLRGKKYDKIKTSYLFNLNDSFVVDATEKGSIIRFANHSNSPNCYCRVLLVNGDHRIGIFAKHNIQKGDELFFNYCYDQKQRLEFVPVELVKGGMKRSQVKPSESEKSSEVKSSDCVRKKLW